MFYISQISQYNYSNIEIYQYNDQYNGYFSQQIIGGIKINNSSSFSSVGGVHALGAAKIVKYYLDSEF